MNSIKEGVISMVSMAISPMTRNVLKIKKNTKILMTKKNKMIIKREVSVVYAIIVVKKSIEMNINNK